MMKVTTELKQSKVHGIGRFATEDIPKGTVVWELDEPYDLVITTEEYYQLPKNLRRYFAFYTYEEEEGKLVFCSDNAKYINHSKKPNVIDYQRHSVAARDIKRGEELVCDYDKLGVTTSDSPWNQWRKLGDQPY